MEIPDYLLCDFPPIYVNLGASKGVYVVEQGVEPTILLHSNLKELGLKHLWNVYKTLYDFQAGLEAAYKLFPLRVYYEDLVFEEEALPQPEPEPEPVVIPEIVVIGRAYRIWRFQPRDDRPHVIGRPA